MDLKIKCYSVFFIIFFVCNLSFSQARKIVTQKAPEPAYKNASLPTEERVKDLLERMTVEEKVYQLCAARFGEGDEVFITSGKYSKEFIRKQMSQHGIGHISMPTTDMFAEDAAKTTNEIQQIAIKETRLGIPTIINDEALHGCKGKGSTSFPQSIALSCTWDLQLMGEIADAIVKETFNRGVRQVLSPVLDLARDPRHGRVEETYGEDPFLASRFGVEYIKGVQQNNVVCTPKHFLANFVADGGRDAGNIALSERELKEVHLVPYKAAITEARAGSIMAAYNELDGVPCSANPWLLKALLRKEWGFKGFVVSDWSGVVGNVIYHHTAKDNNEAAINCSSAGMDVELPRLKCFVNLVQLIKEGKINETSIDENVKPVLRMKFDFGLFDHPFVDTANSFKMKDAFRKLALKAAEESIVLLKNSHHVLPITAKNIAVIGPNADILQLGGYSAKGVKGNTPLQSIKQLLGKTSNITYSKGCNLTGDDKSGFSEAITVAKKSDVCVLVVGGAYGITGGETQDRVDLNLMGVQEDLINAISALGKPVIVVLIDGRPVTMKNWINRVDGIVQMFFGGEEGGNALAEILAGNINPSGKLTITFPRDIGQVPMYLQHRPYGREGSIVEYPEISKTAQNLNGVGRYYPLFPFGYGLSYTDYKYDSIELKKYEFHTNEDVHLSINISNKGKMDGYEIVQVYLSPLGCRIAQSTHQLKAFQRVFIPKGESKKVEFTLHPEDFSFLNEKLQPENGLGEFDLFVGTNCLEGVTKKISIR